jgi:hypothetical protein
VYARQGLPVELQGKNTSLQNGCHRQAVFEIRPLKSHWQVLALGSHVLDLGIDTDVVFFEDRFQWNTREADVAHTALIPWCARDVSVLRPAISRALKDHLVFDLIHVEQLFSANNDSKGFDQSDKFGLPAF